MSKTSFPILYHLGKKGVLYDYEVWADGDKVYSSTGQVGGKHILSCIAVTSKNIDKVNATSFEEQAIKEAKAKHVHKLTRKYSLTPEQACEEDIQPMLAKKFDEQKKKVYYPADFQPKLDGVRALAQINEHGRVILTSRGAREWETVKHINDELQKFMKPGDVLDGELYIHGVDFQTLTSWVKRLQPDTLQLEYHIYDMPSSEGEDSYTWLERKERLAEFFKSNSCIKLKHVPSRTVSNENEITKAHEEVLELGYEGGIIRLHEGLYTYGYRSYELLKIKWFDDAEFKVTGVTNGVGKFANSAIWICKNAQGKEFRVTPKCSQEQKERYLREADMYIGEMLTVEFFGLTNDGIPRFPIGKGFRPGKDLSK